MDDYCLDPPGSRSELRYVLQQPACIQQPEAVGDIIGQEQSVELFLESFPCYSGDQAGWIPSRVRLSGLNPKVALKRIKRSILRASSLNLDLGSPTVLNSLRRRSLRP